VKATTTASRSRGRETLQGGQHGALDLAQ